MNYSDKKKKEYQKTKKRNQEHITFDLNTMASLYIYYQTHGIIISISRANKLVFRTSLYIYISKRAKCKW